MQRLESNKDRAWKLVTRLALAAFLGTGFAMMWLWDTMAEQSCSNHPRVVVWKGIRACATATQANFWRIGTVALVALVLLTIASSLFLKARRARG
jgi:hypothetical protein